MQSPLLPPWLGRFASCLALVVVLLPARAHHCGESPITVEVGRTIAYRIIADLSEREESRYELSINSDLTIALASPDNFTSFNYGEFRITGVSPGTNRMVFEWSYAPTPANDFCVVDVIVVPRGQQPQTAASHPKSGHDGDPVNTFTGEFLLAEEPDLHLLGPMPLHFSRYYASGLLASGIPHGSLEPNWLHNFDHRLLQTGDRVDVLSDRGRVTRFQPVGDRWELDGPPHPPFQRVQEADLFLFGDPLADRVLSFNSAGQLFRIEDGRGNAHQLNYTSNRLTSVSDGLGREIAFTYFGLQHLLSISAGPRQVQYGYGASDQLTSVRDFGSATTTYTYTPSRHAGLLASRRLPLGNTHFTNVFDELGRIQAQRDAFGNTHAYAWSTNGTTVITDPLGFSTRHVHSALGQLLAVHDEEDRAITMRYSDVGQRVAVTDRAGGLTQTAFHPLGKLASITHADLTVTRYTYQPRLFRGIVFHDLSRAD